MKVATKYGEVTLPDDLTVGQFDAYEIAAEALRAELPEKVGLARQCGVVAFAAIQAGLAQGVTVTAKRPEDLPMALARPVAEAVADLIQAAREVPKG